MNVFKDVAKKTNSILLPFILKGVVGINEFNQEDKIHPNKEGAKIIADNLWTNLRAHL